MQFAGLWREHLRRIARLRYCYAGNVTAGKGKLLPAVFFFIQSFPTACQAVTWSALTFTAGHTPYYFLRSDSYLGNWIGEAGEFPEPAFRVTLGVLGNIKSANPFALVGQYPRRNERARVIVGAGAILIRFAITSNEVC